MSLQTRLRISLVLLAGVLVLGATGFHYIEGWPWFDGLYMTLITMTTVGYGETHPLSPTGRVFNTFLILAAATAGAFLLATFTQAMLEFELGKVLGRRRMERELAHLTEHYIICGAGRVGRTVARELRARGKRCVIIEKDAARAQWAMDENIPVLIGTGTTDETLKKARIEHAAGFIAAVTSDADNLYLVLTARGMRPDIKIIARVSEEEATSKLLRAGASQVISPYHFVGNRIVQLFLRPNVLDFIDTAFGTERLDIEIEEIRVRDNSKLVGKSIGDSGIRQQAGAIILAVKRADGTLTFNPPLETSIRAGDFLIAIGAADHLRKLGELAGA